MSLIKKALADYETLNRPYVARLTRLLDTVWTCDGNRFTFDVQTGEIVSRFVRPRWVGPVVLTAGVVALLAWYLSSRYRCRAAPASSPVPDRDTL